MKRIPVITGLALVSLAALPAFANTNAACGTAGEHIANVLSNMENTNPDLLTSLETFRVAQLDALDRKIKITADGFGVDEAGIQAESKTERDAMKIQLEAKYGVTDLHQDYAEMLINCVKASSEVELGQTQGAFMATINEIRRMIG